MMDKPRAPTTSVFPQTNGQACGDAQWLTVLAVPQDSALVPNTQVRWLTTLCHFCSRESMPSSGLHCTVHMCNHRDMHVYTHINKNRKKI